jgi:hypothetical protein
MYNNRRPHLSELPSHAQLRRSTLRSIISALAILVAIVLPAEYGIDITGIGSMIGLKEMGEIKQQLAAEAREDIGAPQETNREQFVVTPVESYLSSSNQNGENVSVSKNTESSFVSSQSLIEDKRDNSETIMITIPKNGYAEIKAVMNQGDTLEYSWETTGGALNYNVHGEPSETYEVSSHEYADGRSKTFMDGSITAIFNGTHGWFWRNRSGQEVVLKLTVNGEFSSLIQV